MTSGSTRIDARWGGSGVGVGFLSMGSEIGFIVMAVRVWPISMEDVRLG